jgi:hypothetical protein
MMNPSTPLVLTVLTVAGGRIVRGNDPIFTDRMIVGGMMLIFGVAAANTINPGFAAAFATLIFVAAFLIYGVELMTAIGFQVKGTS